VSAVRLPQVHGNRDHAFTPFLIGVTCLLLCLGLTIRKRGILSLRFSSSPSQLLRLRDSFSGGKRHRAPPSGQANARSPELARSLGASQGMDRGGNPNDFFS